jgi:hypothetical protein
MAGILSGLGEVSKNKTILMKGHHEPGIQIDA